MEKQEFKQMLDAQDDKFKSIITQALADQSRDLRDYTDQRLMAFENRIVTGVDAKLSQLKEEILEGVGEMFDGLNPQFNNHERRILKLEKLVHAS